MKKFIYLSMWSILCVTMFMLAACSDSDSDTTKPAIELIEPAEGEVLLIGSEHGVHFEMKVSDDVMLKSYKIEIHSNFDNHGHETGRSAEATLSFRFDKVYDLSGSKNADVHHHDILIPANATPGNYHLMVYCIDAAGNQSLVTRNIVLSHTAEEHEHDHDDEHEH